MNRTPLLSIRPLTVAIALAGIAGTGYGDESDTFTPFHVARVRTVADIVVAPDLSRGASFWAPG